MNLTMTTKWIKNDRHDYLIVNLVGSGDAEESASQIYLDIRMPKEVRIRHIGDLPSDGHGNSIGVDIPDMAASDSKNIVFKVKSFQELNEATAPELHLHWIDSTSGDLLERHQTGTAMPLEATEVDENLNEIVAAARSAHKRPNSRRRVGLRRKETTEENTCMNTERHLRTKRSHRCGHDHIGSGRHSHHVGARTRQHWHGHGEEEMATSEREITRRPRRGHRHHDAVHQDREAFQIGRGFGRHARGSWNEAQDERQWAARRHGKGHLHRTIAEMRERMEELEHRIARMQGTDEIAELESRREIARTRRERGSKHRHDGHHYGRRMRGEGRRMGHMMHRAVASQLGHDDRHPDA